MNSSANPVIIGESLVDSPAVSPVESPRHGGWKARITAHTRTTQDT